MKHAMISLIARLTRSKPIYTCRLIGDGPNVRKGVTLWSTLDYHEAAQRWKKSLGEKHGKGRIQFTVEIEIAWCPSQAKEGRAKDPRQKDAFPEGKPASVLGAVPAGIPETVGVGPKAADSIDPAEARSARPAGSPELHHQKDVKKVDLVQLMKGAGE